MSRLSDTSDASDGPKAPPVPAPPAIPDGSVIADPLVDLLMRLRPHLVIAHHIPGRIRLTLAPAGLIALGTGRLSDRDADHGLKALGRLFGPHALRLNPAARSIVITHDPNRFPDRFWQTLTQGSGADIARLIARASPTPRAPAPRSSPPVLDPGAADS